MGSGDTIGSLGRMSLWGSRRTGTSMRGVPLGACMSPDVPPRLACRRSMASIEANDPQSLSPGLLRCVLSNPTHGFPPGSTISERVATQGRGSRREGFATWRWQGSDQAIFMTAVGASGLTISAIAVGTFWPCTFLRLAWAVPTVGFPAPGLVPEPPQAKRAA
jgi:hypothetical protein